MHQSVYETSRLQLKPLEDSDASFIIELLNSPGWLQFIGDRNVHTNEDALRYIHKITAITKFTYWVCRLKENATPIGIITLLKRDEFEHHDIGFAFLPQFEKQGYAFEASSFIVDECISKQIDTKILAITLPENKSSIALIEKLGLSFLKHVMDETEELMMFSRTL